MSREAPSVYIGYAERTHSEAASVYNFPRLFIIAFRAFSSLSPAKTAENCVSARFEPFRRSPFSLAFSAAEKAAAEKKFNFSEKIFKKA